MKKATGLVLMLLLVFCFGTVALAGDSVSLKVSCTIPEIPGVNAPPFPDQAEKNLKNDSGDPENQDPREQEEQTQIQNTREGASYIAHEQSGDITASDGKMAQVVTRTIYRR
ncbi:MAG: hypothetical protein PHS09_00650 [Candidatus Omnitrophica bacterium]|nr:hypothetical protein [Candidatus Omnitrophota bacterium]MDD5512464.1 hypothetical protein [Candidatus Omnitrophota bacterium]